MTTRRRLFTAALATLAPAGRRCAAALIERLIRAGRAVPAGRYTVTRSIRLP